jgi:hypothetical protein
LSRFYIAGVISLTGEERELLITPLPVTLETESVRVNDAGTVGVRLLGVSSDRIYTTEPFISENPNINL